MSYRLVLQGSLITLAWILLVIPSIVGYLKGTSYTVFYRSYILGQMQKTPLLDSILLGVVFLIVFVLYFWTLRINLLNISSMTIFVWTAVFTVILVLLFPYTCHDVFYYIATGQQQSQYQINPYLTSVHQMPDWRSDPLLSNTRWGFLLHVYGPLWAKVSSILIALASNSLWAALFIFKAFAGLVHLLNLVLIGLTARRLNLNTSWAMLAYGWNPLLLFELPGHAHNDALLLTFIILALYFLTISKGLFSIPALTLAATVKYTSILLIPLFAVWLLLQRKIKPLILGGLISLGLLLAAWYPIGKALRP
ncbi:hypothetical protein N752_26245 [Desulforamulus aquiferis]|nr:hypothetical protein [Desulforamulus aquiferis]RYD02210.1 hypothetical protein N752_26245 [Desulforamulus aquiferis]